MFGLVLLLSTTAVLAQYQQQQQSRSPHHYTNYYQSTNYPQRQQQQQHRSPQPPSYPVPVQVVHHYSTTVAPYSTSVRPTHPTHNTYYTTHQQTNQPVKSTTPARYGGCNVPSDFWCDSYEMAQRCDVVKQCEQFKLDRRPLTVTLMYEALCPFCQRFISNHLGNLFNTYRGRVEFELVPWGNSRLLNNGQISCNHGQTECDANRLMSCVIDVVQTKQAIPFIICFERQLGTYPQVQQAMHHCSTFISNAYREIKTCFDGERGRQLQRQAAYRTMNMRAHPIIEVPYLVINNYSPSSDANGLNIMTLHNQLHKWLNMKKLT
ncbi:unnamed protein product [Bursaphelenchus okinawaensis]|uniref:Saposin A-type domain-containing protein n=1 Tax=Bursaphelenchus okinawaensis TaxID=465554 RepID=A0A811K8A4_9BILA|nr:unnamed protein product [Bursaphelenchus okinawaensis]CAG9093816.1 unnamed protein product [Bursaphelenchus okinawaensis]